MLSLPPPVMKALFMMLFNEKVATRAPHSIKYYELIEDEILLHPTACTYFPVKPYQLNGLKIIHAFGLINAAANYFTAIVENLGHTIHSF